LSKIIFSSALNLRKIHVSDKKKCYLKKAKLAMMNCRKTLAIAQAISRNPGQGDGGYRLV